LPAPNGRQTAPGALHTLGAMTTKLQVRVYPGNVEDNDAAYLYNVTSEGPLPAKGDGVRLDMTRNGEVEGRVEEVSWSVGFDFLILDVVTIVNDQIRAIAADRKWVDLSKGNPVDADRDRRSSVPERLR
jgi:hypothetical protein